MRALKRAVSCCVVHASGVEEGDAERDGCGEDCGAGEGAVAAGEVVVVEGRDLRFGGILAWN